MNKIVVWYLKKQINKLSFQEESLEISQDIIENVNSTWQNIRQKKDILKSSLKIIKELNSSQ